MPLTQVSPGDRILSTDINQYYNILKGVAASGEAVTLIYNAAASLVFQPSSDPAAGTEAIQIKNNAGTVQGSLTFDGKFKAAAGSLALPGLTFQGQTDMGWTKSNATTAQFAISGVAELLLAGAGAGAVNALQLGNSNTGVPLLITATGTDAAIDIGVVPVGVGVFDLRYATIALGGGAAPTLGTIGGSGPGTAGQNSWLKVKINGTASYVPVWR